jgi:hypothetical protein
VTSRTVSPLSLIKLEQAWLDRLWFKEGRYSTRPDWLYLATVDRESLGAVKLYPPVTIKCSPTSIPQAKYVWYGRLKLPVLDDPDIISD